ncbi:MAG: hypothetical protein HQ567_01155, partial [Candidatus Nealsonbacteria bacterium]|nr:hypothetical protein [Candidatus Nealsonbacteria bacterium]
SVAWWSNMDTHQEGAQISSDSNAGSSRFILQDNGAGGNTPLYANGDVFGGALQYTADSQWHHYALTVDNTNGGTWKFYVDGTEEGSATHTFTMSAYELQMGKHVDVYFEGMIDEVYAYNRALTAAQIAEMAGIEVVDMSSYNVTVTEPSTLDAAHTPWLDLGTLTMRDGAVLQTTGAPISFTGTELAADAAAVGFDPQTSTDYGTITNSSAMAEVVVSKTGSSTWELDAPFAGTTDNIKWKVEEGTLAVGGDDTLGGRPVTIAGGVLDTLGTASIGSSPVEMTGGTLSVHLPPLKNLSSGFDETSGTTVADGDPDPIYTLTVSPQDLPEDLPKPATVISPHPAWLANNTASKWIGPAHPGTTRIAVGDYEFEATFDLSGLDLETVAVALNLASDNLITDVLLNGTSTGITQAGFAGLSPTQFLDTGLIDGLNTLTFKLTNDAPVDAGGLRVQAGVYQSEQILDLGATAITVNGGGTLDLHGPWAAQVGPVVLKAGTLTTAGTIAETIFGGTTLDVEAVDVGLNTQVVTNPGALDGTALVAPATLAKTGLSDLVMDQPGVNLGQLTIDVQQGRLIVTGGTAPVDDAVLQLGGGELVLAADSSDGSLAFDKAVAVTAPSSLTAGPGHTATTNVAVTLGSAAAGVTLGDGATLTLGSTDDYSLDVAGDVNGAAGGLSVSQGDVTLSGGTNVLSLDVTGGTLNANAVVSAGNLTATGGMLNTAAAAVTTDSLTVAGTAAVSAAGTGIAVNDGGTAKIGPTTFQTTGGTMSFAGSVLATGTDTLILGGGDVTVTAPGFGEVTPGLSYHLITNDADSGIDPVNKTYTHAIDFGSAGTAIVNGLTFANDFAGNGSEDVPNRHGGNLATAVTGEIAKVFQDMDYNAFPAQIILAGLTEGEVYDLRLYNRSWGANGTRTQIFKYDIDNDGSFEGDPLTLNTDVPTDNPPGFDGAAWNVGYAQSYTYTAGPGGEIRVEITPTVTNNSYHLYGLTNEIATGSLVTLPADVTLQNLIGIGTINAAAVDVLHTIAPGNDGIGKITVGVAELGMDPGVTYNAEISLADVTAVVADQIEV